MYTREEREAAADRLTAISIDIKAEADFWETHEEIQVATFLQLRAWTLDLKAARLRLELTQCSQPNPNL